MQFNSNFNYIIGDKVDLKLILTLEGNDYELPYYWFEIIDKDLHKPIGKVSIRIGHNYHSYFNGNIGYEIDEEYRGKHYAYYASLMVLEIAKYHNMTYLYITCDYDNIASIKTIEKLGGKLIEEVVPPKDYIFYYEGIIKQRIYKIEIVGE